MQRRFSLAGLAFGCILGTSAATLEVVQGVNATANGWDTRTYGFGCSPNGCVPANVLNTSLDDDSRWACRPSRSEIEVCELTFTFDEPQDIFEMRMAVWKGDGRTRILNIWVDGVLTANIQTSAATLEYEAYELSATQTSMIVLQGAGIEEDRWLSIMGVQLMKESEPEVFPPGPAPTSEDYVGCFNDMVGDRLLTTVSTDEAMTPEVCEAKCAEMTKHYYGLQQGNECWCAGCEITERDTNIDFDRHGDGVCNSPCAGDPTSTCGGDLAIDLYQTSTCLATPAPTPAVTASECPSGSTEASLEITVTWEDSSRGVELHVIEPGGVEVTGDFGGRKLGDVGMWADGRNGYYGVDNPASETYLTLNGLNVADDAVLGDYEVWGTARWGTVWTITARSGGELLWIAGGVFSEFQANTERFTATVSSYADSDCSIDAYGKCPSNTFSSDGVPPCRTCPSDLVASGRSTYCTVPALRNLDLPESIADIIIADAVAGWAGLGHPDLADGTSFRVLFVDGGQDNGTVSVSGNFARYDDIALPPSTTLYVYHYNDESENDGVRGEGVIDPATGDFTVTITDLPVGYSRGILSFAVLDPADASVDSNSYGMGMVFDMDVVNEGCSDALRIKLEWELDEDLDLWVTDPNGDRVSFSTPATDIGYINDRNGGTFRRNPDTGNTSSFEEYVLFSGLSGDAMLGEYKVFARSDYAEDPVAYTLTATVGGVVEWVEEGELIYMYSDDSYYTDDDSGSSGASRRALITTDDDVFSSSYDSYSYSSMPQSDTFTVTLGSYDPVGC